MTTQHKQPQGAETAGTLSHAEVTDEADSAVQLPKEELKGKRVRAIPGSGGTTVRVRRVDFKNNGIDHPDVVWDFRKEGFTVPVGGRNAVLTKEAADFLTKEHPHAFEYINNE